MADEEAEKSGDGQRTSLINETFDDLVSESSEASLKKSQSEDAETTEADRNKPKEEEHHYEKLENVVTLVESPEIEEATGPPEPAESDNSSQPEVSKKPEPFYDTPIFFDHDYDEPHPVPPKSDPPLLPPPNDTPTLAVEEEAVGSYQSFSDSSSPRKLTKKGGVGTSPSRVVAHGNVDSEGSSSVPDGNHRPLPVSERKFPDSLRRVSDGEDLYDLQVNITAREKHTLSKTDSYITYRIETTSLRPRHLYEKANYLVWRRYRDFEWLHEQMERNHPTLILPPLPGKQITRYFDHMSETFLEERQRCLDQFLWRLVTHPFFSYDNSLKMFLTADDQQFTDHVTDTTTSSKFMGMVSTSVKQAATSIRLKNPDSGFTENSKYFSTFSEKMGVLERIETRLQSDRKELSSAYDEMSDISHTWASTEGQLGEGIKKMGGAFEANSSALDTLNESNSYSFQLALRMYQYYANSAVSALKRRDGLQLEHELASDDKEKKKKLHEDAVQAGKTEKITKTAQELEKSGVTAEHAQDKLAQSNEQLRVDMEKWKEAKDKEMRQTFINWSGNQIQYHERMFHEWEEALLLLRQLGPETEFASQY